MKLAMKRGFGRAAVCARAVAAGTMASRSGRASVTPAPRSTVRRDRYLLVRNMTSLSLKPHEHVNSQLPTPNSQLPTPNSQLPTANQRLDYLGLGGWELGFFSLPCMRKASLDTMPDTIADSRYSCAAARRTTARTWGISCDSSSLPSAYIMSFSVNARTKRSLPPNNA